MSNFYPEKETSMNFHKRDYAVKTEIVRFTQSEYT